MSDPTLKAPLRDVMDGGDGRFSASWQRFFARLVQEFADNETPTGVVNGVNRVFTLANTPKTGSLILVKVPASGNAWPMILGRDYTLLGLTFTDAVAPIAGQSYRAWYRR